MEDIKILVVEDEGIIGLNIKKKLKSFGYTVPAIVATGEEAIINHSRQMICVAILK